MEPVYITGHRNPDTDSIVSAMAYAALRNSLGDRNYIPARLGHISDETRYLLDRFGFPEPQAIQTMRTQVRDLDYDTPPTLSAAVTLNRAWDALREDRTLHAIPVTDAEGKLFGVLSSAEIAAYDMQTIRNPQLEDIPLFNLLSVLEGEVLTACETDSVSGQVTIALPAGRDSLLFSGRNNVVICGDQEEMIRRAIREKVSCVIVCQAEVPEALVQEAGGICIVATPYDPVRAARLVYHAIPISRICTTENLLTVHLDDYVDEAREMVLANRRKNYPILDADDKVVGSLTRYHLLKPRRKKVILVDHNEAAQSVAGLNQAEILEIIDHHRLADIQTANPIYVRNEPVGSTATIIASMYQEKGLLPTENLAGLMAAAIVADTVMFQSPTCTEKDRRMARRMARISGISLDELGKDIFSAAVSDDKSAESLFLADYKAFHIAEHDFGVSQITCVGAEHMLKRKAEFLAVMEKVRKDSGMNFVILMLTDALAAGTQIIYLGKEDIFQQAFGVSLKDSTCFLPGILSRKKQVIPALTALWG